MFNQRYAVNILDLSPFMKIKALNIYGSRFRLSQIIPNLIKPLIFLLKLEAKSLRKYSYLINSKNNTISR